MLHTDTKRERGEETDRQTDCLKTQTPQWM